MICLHRVLDGLLVLNVDPPRGGTGNSHCMCSPLKTKFNLQIPTCTILVCNNNIGNKVKSVFVYFTLTAMGLAKRSCFYVPVISDSKANDISIFMPPESLTSGAYGFWLSVCRKNFNVGLNV